MDTDSFAISTPSSSNLQAEGSSPPAIEDLRDEDHQPLTQYQPVRSRSSQRESSPYRGPATPPRTPLRNDDGNEREHELRSELWEFQRRLTLAENQLQHVSRRCIELTTEAGSRAQASDVNAQQMANVAREEQVLAERHATQSIMIGSEAMALRDQRDVATGEETRLYNHLH